MYIKRVKGIFSTMRKIEQQMQNAIRNRKNWSSSNTSVSIDEDGFTSIRLHGNRIAEIAPHGDIVLSSCGWETVTTKSRLNAILDVFFTGFGIWQRDFTWYIGGNGSFGPKSEDEFFDGYTITR